MQFFISAKYKNVDAKDLQVLLKDVVPQDLLRKVTADKKEVSRQELTQWNFMNSVFFATSVITTIGKKNSQYIYQYN